VTDCPKCRRRLLSHASAKCNWCGAEIVDADYQAQAQADREAYFVHQAQHDAQSLAQIDAINVNAYDTILDPFTTLPYPQNRRRGTPIRPLTYDNQTPAVRSEMQTTSVWPRPADKICENELAPETADADPLETGKQGRFQHLEL
jgi:hypothetical protein